MHTHWLDTIIPYDGSQLRAHWIAAQTGQYGDAMVAFRGRAAVDARHMVDLEDVAAQAWIASDDMLHFIVEHFDHDLERMILRQRLFIVLLAEQLRHLQPTLAPQRRGDDLYDGDAKLTVSIATASPISCLIHTGINISSANTPVLTKGLHDYGIAPEPFAHAVMQSYADELAGIHHARCKVRGTD